MGIISGGERHCKMMHVENGRVTVRRIHHIMVQATDGRLHSLTGDRLPDSICMSSGQPNEEARAEIILGMPRAPSLWVFFLSLMDRKRARDFAFMLLGMVVTVALSVVADAIAQLLHV